MILADAAVVLKLKVLLVGCCQLRLTAEGLLPGLLSAGVRPVVTDVGCSSSHSSSD